MRYSGSCQFKVNFTSFKVHCWLLLFMLDSNWAFCAVQIYVYRVVWRFPKTDFNVYLTCIFQLHRLEVMRYDQMFKANKLSRSSKLLKWQYSCLLCFGNHFKADWFQLKRIATPETTFYYFKIINTQHDCKNLNRILLCVKILSKVLSCYFDWLNQRQATEHDLPHEDLRQEAYGTVTFRQVLFALLITYKRHFKLLGTKNAQSISCQTSILD